MAKKCITIKAFTRSDGTKVEEHERCFDSKPLSANQSKKKDSISSKLFESKKTKGTPSTDTPTAPKGGAGDVITKGGGNPVNEGRKSSIIEKLKSKSIASTGDSSDVIDSSSVETPSDLLSPRAEIEQRVDDLLSLALSGQLEPDVLESQLGLIFGDDVRVAPTSEEFDDALLSLSTLNDLESSQIRKPIFDINNDPFLFQSGTDSYVHLIGRDELPSSGPVEFAILDKDNNYVGFARAIKSGRVISTNMIHVDEEFRGQGAGTGYYKSLLDNGFDIKSDSEITDATYSLYGRLKDDGYNPLVFQDGRVGLTSSGTIDVAQKINNGFPMSQTNTGAPSILYKDLLDFTNGDAEVASAIKANTYSKDFKAYFGDWENDPENASKVVDVNGEPQIVYHGGSDEIRTFDENFGGFNTGNNDHGAFFFTDDYTVAEDYSRQSFLRRWDGQTGDEIVDSYGNDHPFTDEQLQLLNEDSGNLYDIAEENLIVIPAFVNVKDPFVKDYRGEIIDTEMTMHEVDFVKNKNIGDNFEFYEDYSEIDESIIDDFSEEIEERAIVNYDLSEASEIKDYMRSEAQSEILDENYIYPELRDLDGLILNDVIDSIGDASHIRMKEVIVIQSSQIKSPFNCCQFDSRNSNIYGTKSARITRGTRYEGMTVREIMETSEGIAFLKENGYFEIA